MDPAYNFVNFVNYGNMHIYGVPPLVPEVGVPILEVGRAEEEEVEGDDGDGDGEYDEDYADGGEEGDIDEEFWEGDDEMYEEGVYDEEGVDNLEDMLRYAEMIANDINIQIPNHDNLQNNFNVQYGGGLGYNQQNQNPFPFIHANGYYGDAGWLAPEANLDVDPALFIPRHFFNYHLPPQNFNQDMYHQHNADQALYAPQQLEEAPLVQPDIIYVEEYQELYRQHNADQALYAPQQLDERPPVEPDIVYFEEDYEADNEYNGEVIDVDAEDYDSETASEDDDDDDDDVVEVDAYGIPVALKGAGVLVV